MGEEDRKQLLSTGFPAAKNTTRGTRAFMAHRSQMAGKNREGSVANCGDVQILDPLDSSSVTIIDPERCFSFFQSEANQDTNKRTGQGTHIRGKNKSSNYEGKD